MSSTHTPKPRRRGLTAWLAFGAVGLATGAVWATGFASVGGQTGNNDPSPIVAPSAPADHAPELAGLVTADHPTFNVDWNGRWGSVADTNFFTVDLHTKATGTFNVAFLLTNGAALSTNSGWSSLQLKLEAVDAGAGPCDASAFDGTNNPQVMAFDSNDAGVYWNGLPGGKVYCIGVAASNGEDTAGTFIRRDSDASDPSVYPNFIATVDRAS
jgi:hypothetical protein